MHKNKKVEENGKKKNQHEWVKFNSMRKNFNVDVPVVPDRSKRRL